jgi:hypothetical protein
MNDEFLKKYTKRPDPQFAENLYRRLERRERTNAIMRKFALSFTALLIVSAALFAASPTVRAAALEFLQQIGGLNITVTDEPPGIPSENIVSPTFEDVPLSEALNRFDGPIVLPEFVPADFELQPVVRLWHIIALEEHQLARLNWLRTDVVDNNEIETFITLEVDFAPGVEPKPGTIVGTGGVEEVDLNGKQAVLIRGIWDHELGEYVDAPFIFLIWKYDEHTTYTFSANRDMVDEGNLIKMAASIR